jgi:hypothetical protein
LRHQSDQTSGFNDDFGVGMKFNADASNGGYATFAQILATQKGTGYQLRFKVGGTEKMALQNGNLLVGTTSTSTQSLTSGGGTVISALGGVASAYQSVSASDPVVSLNNTGVNSSIITFRKDGSTVGTIGATNSFFVGQGNTGLGFFDTDNLIFPAHPNNLVRRDNAIDLGYVAGRFDDIWATNSTINTSDRNEKQDIEALSDAEQRVAVAAKGLLRKFRWIDAVEAKGDDARIHFGIIAQDLQAAFEAEGLDAARYAMFTSNTWWETQTEVAAVEATQDSEAVDAYTRTDTYDTAEEAPKGATERTRLGVRYSELLAFIISTI